MAVKTLLSEVTPSELTRLKLERTHKQVQQHYGIILRGKRIAKKMYLWQLQDLLKQKGVNATFSTIARWERAFCYPTVEVIEIWASCLDLKMSVFVDSADYRLVRGDWLEKLKALRSDRKITREQIRKAIGINPLKSMLWEKGIKSPNESELKAWAAALGATAQLVFERV